MRSRINSPTSWIRCTAFFYQSWKESSARALNDEGDEVAFYDAIYQAIRRFMMGVVMVMIALMAVCL